MRIANRYEFPSDRRQTSRPKTVEGGGGGMSCFRSPRKLQAALEQLPRKPSILTLRRLFLRRKFCWATGPGFLLVSAKPDRDRANADCRSPQKLLSRSTETRGRSVEKLGDLGSVRNDGGPSSASRRDPGLPRLAALAALASRFFPFLITAAPDPAGAQVLGGRVADI
jgi:hypothetical protein